MNIMYSSFASFLLVTVYLWPGFAAGADGSCNFNESLSICFEHRNYLNEPMKVTNIFRFFSRDLSDSCRLLNTRKDCVKTAMNNCKIEDDNPFKKIIFPRVETGIYYICNKKFQVFQTNRDCLSKQETISSATPCQEKLDKHLAHGRHARHACSDFESAVNCIKDVVMNHCGSESANAMDGTARIFLGIRDVQHDCSQYSSAGATIIGVSSFVLSTAFMFSFLH